MVLKGKSVACQNLYELRGALVEEWQIIQLRTFHRLVQTMSRRVDELFRTRGGYTC
jgi:hypothetical protein